MSAREKGLVLRTWVRFLKHGLRDADFTKRLYDHLIQHCGFIAHYNRSGFYRTYFESGEETVKFLSQFDKRGECRSVEYGGPWVCGSYADINGAMVEEAAPYVPSLIENAESAQRDADLAEAGRLLAKHGLQPARATKKKGILRYRSPAGAEQRSARINQPCKALCVATI
ncbi:MAG: hypothetical protein ABSH56_37320 [Bryobacteraceae bacterium]